MRKSVISVAASCLITIAFNSYSAPITIQISDPDVLVTYGGIKQTVDLSVVFTADTNNYQNSLASGAGSGYRSISLTYTSADLGLIDVPGTDLWEFSYAYGGFQDGWALHDIEIVNGRGAVGFNNSLLVWDGISAIGPIGPSDGGGLGFSTTELPGDVVDGQSLIIEFWDIGSTITATTSFIPLPAAVWLFGSGLIGLIGIARRKKA